jgi:transposase
MMSQKPGILSILCVNRQRGHEFNETIKALMVQAVESGRSYRDVAREARCSPQTVTSIYQRWINEQSLDKKCRSGRPRKLSFRQIQYLLISLKRDRRVTYQALTNFLGTQVSQLTIRRTIRRHYGRKWRAMQRIPLSKETARTRLSWCQAWKPNIEELLEVCRFENHVSVTSGN